MNTLRIALLAGALLLLRDSLPAQGPLPPPGAPASTMKTLDQLDAKLEKRTPITSTGGPFNITSAGSYYLTRNIGYGEDGVVITADDVTVDLNGFSLLGPGTGAGSGIVVSGAHQNINIRNGVIRGFGAHGISAGAATHVTVDRVTVAKNGPCPNAGMVLGNNARVLDCNATGNCNGIVVGASSIVTRCNASTNTGTGIVSSGTGSIVESCSVSNNTNYGIAVTTNSKVTNCSADSNGSRGITAVDGCSITHCVVSGNKDYGIYTEKGATVSECTASAQNVGIRVGDNSTISGCTASDNHFDGLETTSNCLVIHNNASNNLSNDRIVNGIHLYGTRNRVDSNVATNNGAGIVSNGGAGADIVIRNVASDNGLVFAINYSPTGGDTLGPTDKPPSAATSPWANFQ